MFNPSYMSAAKSAGKVSEDGPSGLLGGEAAVRTCLSDATKEDELLSKTMQKPFKRKESNRGGGRSQQSRKRKSRSRSRRRSRLRSR